MQVYTSRLTEIYHKNKLHISFIFEDNATVYSTSTFQASNYMLAKFDCKQTHIKYRKYLLEFPLPIPVYFEGVSRCITRYLPPGGIPFPKLALKFA